MSRESGCFSDLNVFWITYVIGCPKLMLSPDELDQIVALLAFRLGMIDLQGPQGRRGDRGPQGEPGIPGHRGHGGERGERGERGEQGLSGSPGLKGDPGVKGDQGDPGVKGDKGDAGQSVRVPDFSVNAARVDYGYADGSVVMRTGKATNEVGFYTGGGKGNKAILGSFGYDGMLFSSLNSISYTWTRIVGPGGPFYVPPGGPSVQTPYCNIIVDFGPPTGVRILVILDDSLAGTITAAIGNYGNVANTLTYSWSASKAVLIVGQIPPAPGGVAPAISVGGLWGENAYAASALVAANPNMKIVDAYTGDGGMPCGARLPGILLCSGDSTNVTEAGYRIAALSVNGTPLIP